MEMDAGPGCLQPDVALLAEFRGWLDRERGLSPVSVRCYSKQSKAFLAGIGGAGGPGPGNLFCGVFPIGCLFFTSPRPPD